MSAQTDEQRAKEDALLEKANAIRTLWRTLATAFDFPHEEPPRNKCHWDFVLQEGFWLAADMQQERLWKQAAACQLAQEASHFKRASLKHIETRVCLSVEKTATEFGKVRADGAPEFPESVRRGAAACKTQVSAASIKAEDSLHDDSNSDRDEVRIGPLVFMCATNFTATITEQLEQEDVGRLARHADAQAAYHQAYEAARRVQPPHYVVDEDELPLGRRRRRVKPGLMVMGLDDDGYDLGASPMAGRPPRPRPSSIAPLPQRGAMDVDAAGNKRKRKAGGDYGDEEFDPKSMRAAPMRAGSMGNMAMSGGGSDKKGAVAHKGGMAGMKSPQNKAGLQRIDPRSGVRPGNQLWQQRAALSEGPWTPQDDQLLIAIVTEFNQNWHLVADVLRSASTMSGIHRKWDSCKHRYGLLQKHYATMEDPETNELRIDDKLLGQPMMNKVQAKDTIAQCLPVPENVLAIHQRVVADLALRLRQRRMAERKQTRESHMYKAPDNPSHQRSQQSVLGAVPGGRTLSPLELGVVPMDPAFQAYRKAQLDAVKANDDAQAGAAGGVQQPGGAAAAGVQRSSGPGAGGQSEAAAAAAAQAQHAARAAAAAAVAGQGGSQPGGGSSGAVGGGMGGVAKPPAPLPPGMTKEQMIQIVQSTPLQQLQQELQRAQAAVRANATRETQAALSRAVAVCTYGQAYRQAQAKQQAAQARAAGQQGPGAVPPVATQGAAQPQQARGMNQVTPQLSAQLQAAVSSGRMTTHDARELLSLAQHGRLTPSQLASIASGAKPGTGSPQLQPPGGPMQSPQLAGRAPGQQGMQPGAAAQPGMPGQQPGMWGNAAAAQAAAAAAHQAAAQAAAAAAQQFGAPRPPGVG